MQKHTFSDRLSIHQNKSFIILQNQPTRSTTLDAGTVLEIAQMFGGEIKMLPERKGNRMTSSVIISKTEALGWKARHRIENYINNLRKGNWK